MAYVLDGNKKYNIIWGKDFDIWWIIIKNNPCAESARNMIEPYMILSISIYLLMDTMWYYQNF